MTDKEIIERIDTCANSPDCSSGCPYYERGDSTECMVVVMRNAIDLINRKQTEIEKLKNDIFCISNERDAWKDTVNTTAAEAIKEVSERLNEEITRALDSNYKARAKRREKPDYMSDPLIDVINGRIDALTGMQFCIKRVEKEMVGDTK